MDFTQGILAANKPIGEFDPIGSMQKSQKNIADITQQNTANEKSRYELDLTYKLQDAINSSLDANGNPDFKKLAVEGQKRGIAPSVIQYAISTLPAQWEALQKTAQAKRGLAVASPEASSAVQGALATQPAQVPQAAPSAPAAAPAPDTSNWRDRPRGMKQDSQTSVARPVFGEAPVTEEAPTAPVEDKNIFSIMNKAEVKSPFRTAVGGPGEAGTKTAIEGISDYTLPSAGRTVDGAFVPYTEAELAADPQLNTTVAAENYFRTRTGDSQSDANTVAQNYLKSVYDATLASEGAPEPPMPPVDPSPEAMDKYNQAVVAWTNENSKAVGKAKAAVNQVKEAVGKGQFELADKLVSNQGSKVVVDGKEYRAYTPAAREGVAALEALNPVIDGLKESLKNKDKYSDYASLKLLVPQVARVMAMSMKPGSDVSMGSIAEAEAGTQLQGLEAQFGTGDAMTIMASWLTQKPDAKGEKMSLLDIGTKYFNDKAKALSIEGLKGKLEELLHHAELAGEAYRKANLIGYGKKDAPHTSPEAKDGSKKEPNPAATSEGEKKDDWRSKPATRKKEEKKPATPVRVRSIAEAKALPKGTIFIDPTGKQRVR